jgi:RNA polymerase sigma-70 factor (ECF subfamily)
MENNQSEEIRQTTLNPDTWLKDHGDYLFRYALVRLRDRTIAEDVVQETFLAALKGWDQFRGRASVKTWLVGILKHKIIDHFRKNSREIPVTDLLSSDDSPEEFFDRHGKWKEQPSRWGNDPKEALEKKEFWNAFKACMTGLPGHLSQAFALREIDGLESREICNLLKISSTNLNVILFRARARLARCLEKNWFGTSAEEKKV